MLWNYFFNSKHRFFPIVWFCTIFEQNIVPPARPCILLSTDIGLCCYRQCHQYRPIWSAIAFVIDIGRNIAAPQPCALILLTRRSCIVPILHRADPAARRSSSAPILQHILHTSAYVILYSVPILQRADPDSTPILQRADPAARRSCALALVFAAHISNKNNVPARETYEAFPFTQPKPEELHKFFQSTNRWWHQSPSLVKHDKQGRRSMVQGLFWCHPIKQNEDIS